MESAMTPSTAEDVLNALRRVIDPELRRDLVSLGIVRNAQVEDGVARFVLRLTTSACPIRDHLERMARQAVAALPGIREVHVKVEAEVPRGFGLPGRRDIPGVRQVIAVASGKGGVGKSTVAVHLALALAETGAQVGLLDADFYGPNVPQMLGSDPRPFGSRAGGGPTLRNDRLAPVEARGLQVMSFAYLVEPGKPVIWRGPLLMSAVQQMLFDVDWADLDYLVVDLPPGTGDVPLSLVQLISLAGVVVVTTPQNVAVADVVRCIEMFQVTNAPVLGVVENMSYLQCPDCGRRLEVFGHGGGQWLAEQFDIPLLGQIPLAPAICAGGDLGQPMSGPDSPVGHAFRQLAGKVAAQVSIRQFAGAN
ncbi:MAG TPA: Mrp/NBP35 family ATP-binding protein [Anaerolineae bacterium]|nr:Mrp/NBP35 family ATP-binding protein [Anaerolineae bacterium]